MFDLPPSVNKLYQKRRGGGLALTKEAKAFKGRAGTVVSNNLSSVSQLPIDQEQLYQFSIALYFDKLENPGWFEFWDKDTYVTRGKNKGEVLGLKGERKAKSRYKKIDYDNRIKFLQDCVSELVGIPDDSQIFRGEQEKREDPSNPRAEVTIRLATRDQFFVQERS